MSKEEEGQQMFQISPGDSKEPQIGTEILDGSMPSDLHFEDEVPNKGELQGTSISKDYKYIKRSHKSTAADEIKSYSVKGKIVLDPQPKYKAASIVKEHVNTFDVKAFNQQKSAGLKSLWETVVGYVKREVLIQQNYIYIFQKIKEGYMTTAVMKLSELFKIFADTEESKVRLAFHSDKEHVEYRNFEVKSWEEFIEKIAEECSKVGLTVISE